MIFRSKSFLTGVISALALVLAGCPSPTPPTPAPVPVEKQLGLLTKSALIRGTADTLTNLSFSLPESSQALVFYVNPTISLFPRSLAGRDASTPGQESAADRIRRNNEEIWDQIAQTPRGRSAGRAAESPAPLVVGTSTLSYKSSSIRNNDDSFATVPMTLRKSSSPVTVAGDGTRSLHIWVADDCWGPSSGKAYAVTQEMVDVLEQKFLAAGLNNDIFDWTSGLVGEEWGSAAPAAWEKFIGFDGRIHIWLYDLERDNSTNGGLMGYYYSGNNLTDNTFLPAGAATNSMVGFAVDAIALANPKSNGSELEDATWSVNDYWPKETISTLAHELQHAIMFYQKLILNEATKPPETWLNEMCSQVVEDFLSEKLVMEGPRGVLGTDFSPGSSGNTQGRLPLYNYFSEASLTQWGSSGQAVDKSYSTAYAFGAYLARVYGPGLFRSLVQSKDVSLSDLTLRLTQAPYNRSGLTSAGLLAEWTAAVHLSDSTTAPDHLRMNKTEAFTWTVDGNTYKLGSINHHNYKYQLVSGPYKWTENNWNTVTTFAPGSVTVLSLNTPSPEVTRTLNLPQGMEAWVLIK